MKTKKVLELRKHIVILMGGISAEKDISLLTGEAVYQALNADIALNNKYIIDKYILGNNILDFIAFLKQDMTNIVVFNALHGIYGEDGRIASLLDLLQIPYTHSGVNASSLAMNKIMAKILAKSIGIPVLNDKIITPNSLQEQDISYPCMIKPINEGSSVGIYLIKSKADLQNALPKLLKFQRLMCEEYFTGIECTVGVLHGQALAVTDIIPKNNFYDFESKYALGGSKHILPSSLPQNIQDLMKEYSQQLYQVLRARGAIRVDFIYNIEKNKLILLEVNTHPGMTVASLLPEQADYMGINFTELCHILLKQASFDEEP